MSKYLDLDRLYLLKWSIIWKEVNQGLDFGKTNLYQTYENEELGGLCQSFIEIHIAFEVVNFFLNHKMSHTVRRLILHIFNLVISLIYYKNKSLSCHHKKHPTKYQQA